ncbi:PREDICTED: clumping factor A-like [Acropora digitifera]|uniref:clumping factor A-like n=1 Tax=Acropora digitifera TaxID=70779 RepID=UPI00077AED0D|nr:PREDICTED: clumping factor A-like [Acropora digitifera]
MGFGFLFLLISFVPLSKAKDLRHPAASAVDRRSAPDALLGEIFNDPSATSLTKLNLEDSDTNNNDLSGSGSELWSGSGDSPKPSEDSSSQSVTLTANKPPLQQTSTQTETTGSENLDKVITNNSTDSKESNSTVSVKSGEDTATNSTSRTDTDNTKDDTSTTPDITNSDITSTAAQNVPLQSSTNSSSVITQSADTKLPSTEDQSQNSVVQTGESSKSSNDTPASKADFYPAQFQNSLETFPGSPAADFVGQQEPGFDDDKFAAKPELSSQFCETRTNFRPVLR